MGTLLWIGVSAVVLVIALVWLFFRGTSDTDLGSVSARWIADHRSSNDAWWRR
jgi:hypothetical protein